MRDNISKYEPLLRELPEDKPVTVTYALCASVAFLLLALSLVWGW